MQYLPAVNQLEIVMQAGFEFFVLEHYLGKVGYLQGKLTFYVAIRTERNNNAV